MTVGSKVGLDEGSDDGIEDDDGFELGSKDLYPEG